MEDSKVTSEVYKESCRDHTLKPRLSNENVVSRFVFRYPEGFTKNEIGQLNRVVLDSDGDQVVPRKSDAPNNEDVIAIEHSPSTTLQLVGLQIWRGALLLADFILHHGSTLFQDQTVLELGSGVGLTSIVASMFCKKVVCTDIDIGNILDLINANTQRNARLMKAEFLVLGLDFYEKCWSEVLKNSLKDVTVVLAADVIYDNDLTEEFVDTLVRLLSTPPQKTVYIALEKRYVFTIADLDSVAPCYEHFLMCLNQVRSCRPCSSWKVEQLPLDFPQYFNYDRVKELVLWRITS